MFEPAIGLHVEKGFLVGKGKGGQETVGDDYFFSEKKKKNGKGKEFWFSSFFSLKIDPNKVCIYEPIIYNSTQKWWSETALNHHLPGINKPKPS